MLSIMKIGDSTHKYLFKSKLKYQMESFTLLTHLIQQPVIAVESIYKYDVVF